MKGYILTLVIALLFLPVMVFSQSESEPNGTNSDSGTITVTAQGTLTGDVCLGGGCPASDPTDFWNIADGSAGTFIATWSDAVIITLRNYGTTSDRSSVPTNTTLSSGGSVTLVGTNFYSISIQFQNIAVFTGYSVALTGTALPAGDSDPPVVSGITVIGSPSAADASVTFSVDFDENANNVSTDDFTVTTTSGNATGTVSSVSASSGDPITVTVGSITGTGAIRLDLNSSTNITDDAGNGNNTNGFVLATMSGSTHTVDRDAPAAPSTPDMTTATDTGNEEHTAGSTSDNLTSNQTPVFEGTAEAGATVNLTSNIDGAIGSGTATGGNWSITASTLTAGTHTITATATDGAANTSGSSSGLSITVDVTQPTVNVTTTSADPTNNNPIPVTITFNSEAENMKESDITVVNGTTSDFQSADSTTFNVNITPSGNGNVQVSLGAGRAFDRAGNGNVASNTLSLTYDGTSPTLTAAFSTPVDNATGVSISDNIVLDFSENIVKGTGNVTLKLSGGANVQTFDISTATTTTTPGSGAVGISGDKLYINPTNDLTGETTYAIQIASTAIDDTAGNDYAGISNDTDFNFTTVDVTAPTFSGANSTPADDATAVSVSDNIVLDFSENIALGTGNITLKLVGGATVEEFNVATESDGTTTSPTAGRVGITNDKIYINPTSDLTGETSYAIQIAGTAVDDTAGNDFAGISNDTDFNFTTADVTAPVFSSISPFTGTTRNNANVGYTLSEAIASGTATFTRTGGTADPGSPHMQSLTGTELNSGTRGQSALTNAPTLVNGAIYTITFVGTDAAGNTGAGESVTGITIDTTAPTVTSIVRKTPTSETTNATSVTFTVTFSESVSLVDAGDFAISGAGAGGTAAIGTVSGSGTTYDVPVNTINTNGLLDLDFAGSPVIFDGGGNNFGGTISSEETYTIDQTAPTFDGANSTPIDGATTVAANANIIIDFSESIQKGAGNITIRNVTGSSNHEQFDISTATTTTSPTDGNVGISGDKVYLNPTSDMTESNDYSIRIDATAIDDLGGNSFVGITNDTDYNFTVADATAPTIQSSSPSDGDVTVNLAQNLTITFDDNIVVGTGNITIVETGVGTFETLDVTNGSLVNVSGATVTLNPSGTLKKGTAYHITIDATALDDDAANSFAGISNTTDLNFTTVDVVINEIVTDPQQDWSTNAFNGTVGAGAVTNIDEWIELLINTAGLDLTTGWTIEVSSNTFSGNLNAGGAFDVSNYIGSGTANNTASGAYLVLGNPQSSNQITNATTITLKDPSGATVDTVTLGGAAGQAPSGDATSTTNESVQRIPNGTDTDADDADFVQAGASFGAANDNTAPVNPVVTTPGSATTVNAATATISGTHTENGVTVHAYADANNDGTADNTTSLGNSTVSGGNWSFSVNLTGDAANNFVVIAIDGANNQSSAVDVPTITEDSMAPSTTSFTRKTPTDETTNADALTWLVTFNEDVTGVDLTDFSVTGPTGASISVSQVTASTYDVQISGGDLANINGTAGLNFAAAPTITDLAGNALPNTEPATDETYSMDNTAPSTTSFTRKTPTDQTTSADALTWLVTFSEDVTGVGMADFAVTGPTGASISVSAVSASTYDVQVSGGDLAGLTGTVGLNFAASPTITDLAGNALPSTEPATDETYTVDNSAPSTTSFARKTPTDEITNADALTWLVTFSEDVTGVDMADFAVTGPTGASISVSAISASTYDVQVSGGDLANLNGTVGLNFAASPTITDLGGNALPSTEPGTDETYTVDNTAPSTTSFARKTPTDETTNADALTWLVTFSEDVTGVGMADFAVTGPTGASISVSQVTASTYDVQISGGDLANINGTAGLNFAAAPTITDLAGNALPNTEPATDETYSMDNTAPSTTSFARKTPTDQNTDADALTWLVTFSEDVSGVGTADFAVTGPTGASIAVSPVTASTYDVQVSGGDLAGLTGTVGLNFAASPVITDVAGNALPNTEPATDETYSVDNTAPTVTSVSSSTANGSYKAGDMIAVTVTFSESVTVTGTPTLTLETGTTDQTVNYTSGSPGTTLTFNYTVQAGDESADLDYVATNSLALNGGAIVDAVGNAATLTLPAPAATNSLGVNKDIIIDTTAPVLSEVTPVTSTVTNTARFTSDTTPDYIFTTNETGTLTVSGGVGTSTSTAVSSTGNQTITFTQTDNSTALAEGLYDLATVTVTDAAGNVSNTLLVSSFIVDTTSPVISEVTPVTTPGNDSTPDYTFTTNETGTFDVGGSAGTSTSTTISSTGNQTITFTQTDNSTALADGDYTNVTVTVTDAAGNSSNLLSVTNFTIDATAPTITSVSSSTANGSFKAGDQVVITVTFSETVNVTGTPQIELETGIIDQLASYVTGTGTSALSFTYTVTIDDESADLEYTSTTALTLNGGTIKDAGGNDATLTLPAIGGPNTLGSNKDIVIDNTAPASPVVNTPASATIVNAATATIGGTHTEDGVTVHAYADANNDGTADNTSSLGSGTVSGGNWSFSVNLTADSDNNFVVQAQDGAGNVSGDVDVPTITEDSQNPTFSSSTPTDNAIDIGITDNITITFNENIAFGTGNIQVIDLTDASNTVTIDVASPGSQASISGAVLTIDPTNALDLNSNYAVQIDATAIDDLAGNSYAGISDNTTLNFTTIATTIAFSQTASNNGESTSSANLQVELNAASGVNVTADYTVTGTATGGGTDYTLANGTVTITAGQTTANITIASIVDDSLDENNETVIVTLSNPVNAGLGTNTVHTYTINDDDPTPTVTLSQSNPTFAETGGTNTITATSSATSGIGDITVTIALKAGGTATETSDFTLSSTTITITQGSTTGTAILTAVGDLLDEPAETITVEITGVTNANEDGTQEVASSITDDDATPTIQFNTTSSQGAESVSSANLQVDLSAVSGQNVSVDYAVTGTATNGDDFTLANGTLTLTAGTSLDNITIASIVANALDEDDETVIVTLSNPVNATLGTNTVHTYTIQDDDATPTIAFATTSSSGDESVSSANLAVNLSAVSGRDVTVNYAVTGTATGSGTDYTLADGTLTVSAGNATNNITIANIVDDLLDEDNETVIVTLSSPTNATLGANTVHTYTINDNDAAPTVQFDIATDGQAESESAQDLPISVSAASGKTVTVDYAITGTATGGGTDYTLANGTFTFDPGDVGRTFPLTGIVDDALDEENETIIITLSNPTNATLGGQQTLTYTIQDNDPEPSVTLSVDNTQINEASGTATLTATLSAVSGKDVTVAVAYSGSASNGVDYNSSASTTITINAGQTSANAATIITPVNDVNPEANEIITAEITGVTNGIENGTQTLDITIIDDDTPDLTFTTAASNGAESVASANATVDLSIASGLTVTADYAVTGTATGGSDYTLANGTVTFNPGSVQETITIASIVDDAILEDNETVIITLSNLSNANPGTNLVYTYTINNNDAAAVTIADIAGSENAGDITVTATLDNAVQGGFTVEVSTADGTATTADSDYNPVSGQTLTFTGTAGETQTFTVTPTADIHVEGNETINISQANLSGTTLAVDISDGAVVTVNNDDAAKVTIADAGGAEAGGNINLTATLDVRVDGGFTVDVNTADGTAVAASDFMALTSQTLTFTGTAGETQSFALTPTDDSIEEDTESLTVFMNNAAGTNFASVDVSDIATVTITDEDDNTAPTGFTVTWDDTQINAAEAATTGFTFAGAELATTYNYSIASSAGGTAVTGTGTITTATDNVTPVDVSSLPDGTLTLSVTLTDASSNTSTAQTATATLDTTAPTGTSVTSITTDTGELSDDEVTADNTLVFAGSAEEGATVEVFIDGNSIGTTTAVAGDTWSYDHTGTTLADGTYAITAKATDTFGNAGAVSSALAVTVDTGIPSVSITTAAGSLVNSTFNVTITYSEVMSNVEQGDFVVSNATTGNFTPVVANQSWTLNLTPVADGAVSIQVPAATANDASGNDNTASNTLTLTFDGTAPEVTSITRADPNPTIAQEVNFTVVFSEEVSGVDVTDFEVVPIDGVMNPSVVSITANSAANYTVRVDRGTGEGFYGLNLKDDDSIIDNAGNALGGTGTGNGDFTGEQYQTNSSPTDITILTDNIDENNPLNAVITTFTTTDADAGDTFTYSLVAGTGDDDNGAFGFLLDQELIAMAAFDFETKSSYSIRVQTMDNKGGTTQKQFTININDVNEVGTSIELSNDAIDEADDPVLVGVLTTLGDPDDPGQENITHTVSDVAGGANNLLFEVVNGNELRTTGATNFEANTTLTVGIRSTDKGGLTIDREFTITIRNVENEPLRDFNKDEPDARVKNFFTPNGDGQNDRWIIEDILDNPINEVKVYSQAGKLIFSQRNYENDWDGTFNGEPIPPGTYYYEINIYNGESIIRGFLTIIRN